MAVARGAVGTPRGPAGRPPRLGEVLAPGPFQEFGHGRGGGGGLQDQGPAQLQRGHGLVQPSVRGSHPGRPYASPGSGAGGQQAVLGAGLEEDVTGEGRQCLLGGFERAAARGVVGVLPESVAQVVGLGQVPQRVGGDPRRPALADAVPEAFEFADQDIEHGRVPVEAEAHAQGDRGGVEVVHRGVRGRRNVVGDRGRRLPGEGGADHVEVPRPGGGQLVGERQSALLGAVHRLLDVGQGPQQRLPVPGRDPERAVGRAERSVDREPEQVALGDGRPQGLRLSHELVECRDVLRFPRLHRPGSDVHRSAQDGRVADAPGQ